MTKNLVLSSLASPDSVLPLLPELVGQPFTTVYSIQDVAARLAAAPEQAVSLWLTSQDQLLAIANQLVALPPGLSIKLLICGPQQTERRQEGDGDTQQDDTTPSTPPSLVIVRKLLERLDRPHQLFTLNAELSRADPAIKLLGSKVPADQVEIDKSDFELAITADAQLTFLNLQSLSAWSVQPKQESRRSLKCSTAALLRAKRAGHGLPDLDQAPRRWADMALAIWAKDVGQSAEDAASAISADNPNTAKGATKPNAPDGIWALFFVPNGLGLGHVSRSMALAIALCEREGIPRAAVGFWCYSQAAGLIQRAGFSTYPRQTARHLGLDGALWSQREQVELSQFLEQTRPKVLLVDHSSIESHLAHSLTSSVVDFARIWIRRGFWRDQFTQPEPEITALFDAIIVPGDLAGKNDKGPMGAFSASAFGTSGYEGMTPIFHCPPIVLGRGKRIQAQRRVRHQMGLRRGQNCLVSLGGSGLSEYPELLPVLADAGEKAGINMNWLLPPLGPKRTEFAEGRDKSHLLPQLYPLAPYFEFFDGLVLGGGYNSVHEAMMGAQLPVLFIPSEDARKDDQLARVKFFEKLGHVHVLRPKRPEKWADVLAKFLEAVRRRQKRTDDLASQRDGADAAAQYIAQRLTDIAGGS